jgi:hypothetical protein
MINYKDKVKEFLIIMGLSERNFEQLKKIINKCLSQVIGPLIKTLNSLHKKKIV